jgi:peptide/nickel transport system ATP-binding protein
MEKLLEVKNLKKYFPSGSQVVKAVDDVSFDVYKGETLGLVGESGCGKSTTGRAILRLIEPTSGSVKLDGVDIGALSPRELRAHRRNMALIFQDPFSSLDPRQTVLQAISEPIIRNKIATDKYEVEELTVQLMRTVGLAERLINTYPHELDGGRRQRIGIARALAMNPKFIVCDEPVSALDVSIQAQILALLKQLQKDMGLTYIFITHDLSVIYYFADDIAVMYLGQLVEKAPAEELFAHPMHPYTQALLSAIPVPDLDDKRERILLKGEITSPVNLPDECRFAKRCNFVCDECHACDPKLVEVSPNHFVACHFPLK